MANKRSRRSILRNVGTTATVGLAAAQTGVAADEDATTIEKTPLDDWTLAALDRTIRRAPEFTDITAQIRRSTNRDIEIRNVGGYVVSDSRAEAEFHAVYFQFTPAADDLQAGVVWTNSPDGQRIFGRLAGTGTELTETPRVLDEATAAIPDHDSEQIRIERFIEPDSDIAVASIVPADGDLAAQSERDALEYFGTVDLQQETVRAQSVSDFIGCVTSGAGGIVTGGGACAITCRDGCFKKPNYLGCLVCAGCSVAVACYLGKCADEHLSSAFCNAALADCVFPTPNAGSCGVAYGCKIGNCSII
ncbi:hypothetical protein [Natrinema halophilum]|uniref:Uncharacterized protein n=1 Tax=Natrinema halophilum TaxID=1699371 RepID=A0A7D5L3K2_9EURY|nr:hypothetical protein [Natrinema halophilum]QLG50485.1 hypothetical protein HYG82_17340 [Natrinema halophilum]